MSHLEANLGQGIHPEAGGTARYPFQELKEKLGPQKLDVILVLGEGPINEVYTPEELDAEKQAEWQLFSANPRNENQPKFRVVKDTTIYSANKEEVTANSALVKRRWGRMNALAGGLALYLGKTDKLILTGGKTSGPDKPSEAELMEDIIVRAYGRLFFERDMGRKADVLKPEEYNEYIENVLKKKLAKEDEAPNTIGNAALSAYKFPEYFKPDSKVGVMTSGHHTARGKLLVERLTGVKDATELSAQEYLEHLGVVRNKKELTQIMKTYQLGKDYVMGQEQANYANKLGVDNKDLTGKVKGEEKWMDFLEDKEDPNKLLHWIGFAGYLPSSNLGRVFEDLSETPASREAAQITLARVGLDFNALQGVNLSALSPEVYKSLQTQLLVLTERAIRDEGYHAVMAYPKK